MGAELRARRAAGRLGAPPSARWLWPAMGWARLRRAVACDAGVLADQGFRSTTPRAGGDPLPIGKAAEPVTSWSSRHPRCRSARRPCSRRAVGTDRAARTGAACSDWASRTAPRQEVVQPSLVCPDARSEPATSRRRRPLRPPRARRPRGNPGGELESIRYGAGQAERAARWSSTGPRQCTRQGESAGDVEVQLVLRRRSMYGRGGEVFALGELRDGGNEGIVRPDRGSCVGGGCCCRARLRSRPGIQQTEWDEVGNYPTAFKCEAARREEAMSRRSVRPRAGKRTENAALMPAALSLQVHGPPATAVAGGGSRKVGKMAGG